VGSLADRKPSPEELLRRVQADERRARRGRLKVFLGYASRVGKSFRMLDEGRRRKQRGQDVVVAAVQSPVTPDLQCLLDKLEVIPTVREQHAGRTYEVIDLAALFRRHPQVCLIDELAYDNPPGSRNPKRWQDVDELLDRGITVITAVNLHHIDDQQDVVERITGRRRSQTVPGKFLREADEIELVDAAPEDLAVRPGQEITPDKRRVTELRELALLLAADVVEKQLLEYLDCHGLPQTWGVHERILVCLTPRSNAAEMLTSGHRNAQRFHGSLLVCYVEQPHLSPSDRARMDQHLALAREYGAEVHVLQGTDAVDTILAFAREHRVTQLFVGHSLQPRSLRFLRSPVDRLIDAADDFDVRLFPHRDAV
jgi:two-component system, OmpR family, sensor histidine kinase KdpD